MWVTNGFLVIFYWSIFTRVQGCLKKDYSKFNKKEEVPWCESLGVMVSFKSSQLTKSNMTSYLIFLITLDIAWCCNGYDDVCFLRKIWLLVKNPVLWRTPRLKGCYWYYPTHIVNNRNGWGLHRTFGGTLWFGFVMLDGNFRALLCCSRLYI